MLDDRTEGSKAYFSGHDQDVLVSRRLHRPAPPIGASQPYYVSHFPPGKAPRHASHRSHRVLKAVALGGVGTEGYRRLAHAEDGEHVELAGLEAVLGTDLRVLEGESIGRRIVGLLTDILHHRL